MEPKKYNMSFTTGGLFHSESLQLAELYMELASWSDVKNKVLAENTLQFRTQSSLKRITREIIYRLKCLDHAELEFFVKSSPNDQAFVLWLAICRYYKFIAEFSINVLRERYLGLKFDISFEDFDRFLADKSEWHTELEKISVSTRKKIRQVLFRMMREADLITDRNTINAAMLSPEFVGLVFDHNQIELAYFPIFDTDIQGGRCDGYSRELIVARKAPTPF
jgi:hypothetical protein